MLVKLIPVLLLISSAVHAQDAPETKRKKAKDRPKQLANLKMDTLVVHAEPMAVNADTSEDIDPMDTVVLLESRSSIKSRVKYLARDTMVYNAGSKEILLYGDAKVYYEDLTLTADFIKIELAKNLVTATYTVDSGRRVIGLPKFTQGQQDYSASKIAYNFKTKRGFLSEFRTREGEGYVKGQNVVKNEVNEFGIKEAIYTTCEADTPHFHISAAKLKVIPQNKVVGLWPNLVIENVNTPLVFPFAIFPIKKGQSSGLIIPQYGSDAQRGYFLRGLGYYFGLGEHADLQQTGDIYSNYSWGSHTVFRYASRYQYSGNLVLNYANTQFGLPEDPTFSKRKEFQVTWLHNQDYKARPGTTFSANVNLVSNSAEAGSYLANNSYNPTNIVSNQMNSGISFGKSMRGGKYNFTTNARASQNTYTHDMSVTLPEMEFNVSSYTPFKSRFKPVADKWYENISTSYRMQFRNELLTKDTLLFKGRTATEFDNFYNKYGRYGMQHSLPVQTSFKVLKYYTLSARVDMSETWYYKTIRRSVDGEGVAQERTVDGFERAFTYRPGAAINTRFYGLAQFRAGPVSAIRHVMSPTLDFYYQPDFSEPSWGYYKSYTDAGGKEVKYSIFEKGIFGGPGQGKQGNIGFSLDNNIEMKVWKGKDTARKEEKVQLFERLIFADSLNFSFIGVAAQTKLFKNIYVNGSAQMDPYINVIDKDPRFGYRSPRRINSFYVREQGVPGIIRSANVGLSASFNQDLLRGKRSTDKKGYQGELKYINDFPSEYADFNVPWTLTVTYAVSYDRYTNLNDSTLSNYIQTLSYSGDFNLTQKWKIGYSSGYDFRNKQASFTSINITRDLHCWEFKFDWIPFGFRQSFLFTIRVKASILQELKQTRRREWFDRTI